MGPGGVYRGLVADAYPDLLLPPNALPSILVKVISSRLKATRHSILSVRSSEEEALFTLGVWARSDMQQLWRVEKATMSLPQLASRLKQTAKFDVPLPDRSLFQGHAPAKMDARREAIEKYFETVLDSPMNEKGAVVVCQYLSTDVMQTEEIDANGTLWRSGPRSPVVGSDGRPLKEGFLTKRGKNFGGWKSRYFILDDPILRYYETAAGSKGPLLGTIKLTNAQIGKQRSDNGSPARGNERAVDDSIKEFRHALCINEPKRNGGFIRHILCAESDEERDEWVEALLQYVGASPVEKDKGRKSSKKDETSSNRMSSKTSRNKDAARENSIHSNLPEEPEPDETEGLQSVNYEDTLPAQQPSRSMSSAMSIANQPEPSSPQLDATAQNMGRLQGPKIISGPTNGGVIQDAAQWGFKTPESPKAKEKEPRKRGIWGFREKPSNDGITTHSNDSNSDLGDRSLTGEKGSNNQGSSYGRAVFGIPLAEAVDQFTATGNNACLPAVMFRCLEYLEDKNASNEEGIFRLSGSSTLIKQLKERFNTEGDVDLLADGHYYDVHAVASLLKLYLRELPTTVLTRELHIDFLDVLSKSPSTIPLLEPC
jgi:RalA-binding protein 1